MYRVIRASITLSYHQGLPGRPGWGGGALKDK